ncbi:MULTISPECIES: (2Fe-2S)-binding protein [Metabacillus]|uniref:(2Fe-2S)-binding protein n=1 Tax=Metabacillus hrfriensis TaxID=3048891 RepID=A0ACD4RDM4_9BACI|nr:MULTISPECIES: (2Fe-2S)-binding protein [Metabacillus]UAL53061.1 (2Fe-2S)-binding protein [Metabacillus dongyingensis]UOK58625.1 (2Fe-2S)-binding protein [Bacillus sp. OVS6]USK29381.1 (2Fe-2S)-binding protein [Bacillus sp. CMF21]WHZ58605.1 (2Fe-2S)-binding protein [Metabacillus sp. CT-WN-B3]
MDKTTIICRCEEISYEEVEETIGHGARTFDDVKRLTRCGMGPCQAKICTNLVANVIHEQTGKPFHEIPLPRMRMPLSPIKLETLATDSTLFSAVKSVLDEVELEDGKVR